MAGGAELTRPEMKVLAALRGGPLPLKELCKRVAADAELAELAVEELKKKGLVAVVEEKEGVAKITEAGLEAAEHGLPERRLISMAAAAGGRVAFDAAAHLLGSDFGAALSNAFKNRWVAVAHEGGTKYIVFTGAVEKSGRELLLERLAREREVKLAELEDNELEVLTGLEKDGYVAVEGERGALVRLTEEGETAAAQLPPLEAPPPKGLPLKMVLVVAAAALLLLALLFVWLW